MIILSYLRAKLGRLYRFGLHHAERLIDTVVNLEPLTPFQSACAIALVPILVVLIIVINSLP